jgi:hypothetical protein
MPTYVTLPGSKQTLLPNSLAAGPVDKSEIASVTVRVRSAGDPKALAKMAYELAGTPLAKRKYLTYEELETQHGASQADQLRPSKQDFATSDMGRKWSVCAAKILNRACRLGVNCTYYRAAALLSASPQLAEAVRAAKRFRVVP